MRRTSLIVSLLLFLSVIPAGGANTAPSKPAAGDKCPVCGMFVAKYPDFAGQIRFRDGATLFFDGAKDLFKYYLSLSAPGSKRKASDIVAIHVTNYYSLAPLDGRTAWYVSGSDVFGPMGKELIPLASAAEAKEFMTDHKGKKVLRFTDVTQGVVQDLDK